MGDFKGQMYRKNERQKPKIDGSNMSLLMGTRCSCIKDNNQKNLQVGGPRMEITLRSP